MSACEHLEDTGAWVLGALGEDDAQRFADHLPGCAACLREVGELQTVADVLPMASPQLAPPPALKARIMSVVEGEAELLRLTGPEADRAPRRRPQPWWRRRLGVALALGCAVLAVGIGVAVGVSSGGSDVREIAAATKPGGATVDVAVADDGHGELRLTHMPNAPSGRVYQVWTVTGKGAPQPTRTLFTVPRDGDTTVAIDADLDGVDQVLVSDEPPGGSTAPTGSVVIGAQLS